MTRRAGDGPSEPRRRVGSWVFGVILFLLLVPAMLAVLLYNALWQRDAAYRVTIELLH